MNLKVSSINKVRLLKLIDNCIAKKYIMVKDDYRVKRKKSVDNSFP